MGWPPRLDRQLLNWRACRPSGRSLPSSRSRPSIGLAIAFLVVLIQPSWSAPRRGLAARRELCGRRRRQRARGRQHLHASARGSPTRPRIRPAFAVRGRALGSGVVIEPPAATSSPTGTSSKTPMRFGCNWPTARIAIAEAGRRGPGNRARAAADRSAGSARDRARSLRQLASRGGRARHRQLARLEPDGHDGDRERHRSRAARRHDVREFHSDRRRDQCRQLGRRARERARRARRHQHRRDQRRAARLARCPKAWDLRFP